MSRIFRRSIEVVLRFSDEDLSRYLDLCWDHLIGVLRPEKERMQIINYIEAIQAEMKRRDYERSEKDSSSTSSNQRSMGETPRYEVLSARAKCHGHE